MSQSEQNEDRVRKLLATIPGDAIPTPLYVSAVGFVVLGLGAYLDATGWPEVAGLALAYSAVLISLGVVFYAMVKVAFLFDTFRG